MNHVQKYPALRLIYYPTHCYSIIQLPKPIPTMSSCWNTIIPTLAQKLGYSHLKPWQADLTQNVLNGNDVVLTAGTGEGKSTLIFAPLLAKQEVDGKVVGLSVVPTKALGEDQVYLATICAALCAGS